MASAWGTRANFQDVHPLLNSRVTQYLEPLDDLKVEPVGWEILVIPDRKRSHNVGEFGLYVEEFGLEDFLRVPHSRPTASELLPPNESIALPRRSAPGPVLGLKSTSYERAQEFLFDHPLEQTDSR